MSKRGKGEGTVYQRKDGRWVAELTLEDGKRKYFYAKTQEEVVQKQKQAEYELKQGILATGPKQKVGDYLTYWLDQVHKRRIRATSYVRYRIARDRHLIPELGQIQLRKLTMRRIQQFYNDKAEEGQSPSSLHTMQKVLHAALAQAVKERLISINPAKGVSIPAEKKRKLQPLETEQALRLLKTAQGSRLEPFIALAMLLGMRHGEILALHWSEVDLERGKITVRYTLTYDETYHAVQGDPKTEASERTIPLPQMIGTILKEHRTRQREAQHRAGSSWHNQDFVFCTKTGSHLVESNVRKQFYSLLKKAKLPFMHIHDLRHNAVTLLISLGVNPKMVQEMMGHEDIETTMLVYGKINSVMRVEVNEKIDTLLKQLS
jgi:integrase